MARGPPLDHARACRQKAVDDIVRSAETAFQPTNLRFV
jgi:hypothetical protein